MPKNIELVINPFIKDEYLGNYSFEKISELKYINNYGVCLGDNYIALCGSKEDNFAYFCSLIQNEENEYNFAIKVDYILIFNEKEIKDKQLQKIGNLGGLKNYLEELHIDLNKNYGQAITDDHMIIGEIMKFKEKNNNDNFNQENSGINNNKSDYLESDSPKKLYNLSGLGQEIEIKKNPFATIKIQLKFLF